MFRGKDRYNFTVGLLTRAVLPGGFCEGLYEFAPLHQLSVGKAGIKNSTKKSTKSSWHCLSIELILAYVMYLHSHFTDFITMAIYEHGCLKGILCLFYH